jgi:hypothetical protein
MLPTFERLETRRLLAWAPPTLRNASLVLQISTGTKPFKTGTYGLSTFNDSRFSISSGGAI